MWIVCWLKFCRAHFSYLYINIHCYVLTLFLNFSRSMMQNHVAYIIQNVNYKRKSLHVWKMKDQDIHYSTKLFVLLEIQFILNFNAMTLQTHSGGSQKPKTLGSKTQENCFLDVWSNCLFAVFWYAFWIYWVGKSVLNPLRLIHTY